MRTNILVLCIGNPARQDDGLGPAFAQAIEARGLPRGIELESDYQLTVEDSAGIAKHDLVIFVDADANGPEPFSLQRIEPRNNLEFTSHGIEPSTALGLSNQLFAKKIEGILLAIRGYSFDMFVENITTQARANLEKTLDFFSQALPLLKERPVHLLKLEALKEDLISRF